MLAENKRIIIRGGMFFYILYQILSPKYIGKKYKHNYKKSLQVKQNFGLYKYFAQNKKYFAKDEKISHWPKIYCLSRKQKLCWQNQYLG